MHWKDHLIHVIDFEGTRDSGIIEYGVVTLKNGAVAETHTRICRPIGPITSNEARQHGIDQELTVGTLPFAHEWPIFTELRKTGPLAAHHAQVENHLIKSIWPYPPLSPCFLDPSESLTTWGPWIDTCKLYKVIFPGLGSYGLMDLISAFSLEETLIQLVRKHCPGNRQKYHCALHDALASAVLLIYLGNLKNFEELTAEWLIIKSASNSEDHEALLQKRFDF